MANPNGQPLKFPTPEKRQRMWQELCDHVSNGYSLKSFELCDEDTFYSYMKKFPEDCPKERLDEAKRKSMLLWEKIGLSGVLGKTIGFNSGSWIFNMKNRFGWKDKVDVTSDNEKITVFTPVFGDVGSIKKDEE